MAVAYYYVPLPEATDEELEDAAKRPDISHETEVWGFRLVFITLFFAWIAQLAYVGAQEA